MLSGPQLCHSFPATDSNDNLAKSSFHCVPPISNVFPNLFDAHLYTRKRMASSLRYQSVLFPHISRVNQRLSGPLSRAMRNFRPKR
jgi:hypothetical protein